MKLHRAPPPRALGRRHTGRDSHARRALGRSRDRRALDTAHRLLGRAFAARLRDAGVGGPRGPSARRAHDWLQGETTTADRCPGATFALDARRDRRAAGSIEEMCASHASSRVRRRRVRDRSRPRTDVRGPISCATPPGSPASTAGAASGRPSSRGPEAPARTPATVDRHSRASARARTATASRGARSTARAARTARRRSRSEIAAPAGPEGFVAPGETRIPISSRHRDRIGQPRCAPAAPSDRNHFAKDIAG